MVDGEEGIDSVAGSHRYAPRWLMDSYLSTGPQHISKPEWFAYPTQGRVLVSLSSALPYVLEQAKTVFTYWVVSCTAVLMVRAKP